MTEKQKRKEGDRILEEMSSVNANFGTGSRLDLRTKEAKNKRLCDLWRELKEIDSERADRVKPQNPYVK